MIKQKNVFIQKSKRKICCGNIYPYNYWKEHIGNDIIELAEEGKEWKLYKTQCFKYWSR